MSLIIALQIPTGLVLSGDSRTTYTRHSSTPDQKDPTRSVVDSLNLVLSDAAQKVFKVHDRFGVGTHGAATVHNLPIAHYVEQFELQTSDAPPQDTPALARSILAFFRKLDPIPQTWFIVTGYDEEPQLHVIDVANNSAKRVLHDDAGKVVQYGAQWGGDIAIVNRLLSDPANYPPWPLMNLQDASDFSRHLIRTTIDQLRFEPRFSSVGGPIDTLIVTPKECRFLVQKSFAVQ